MTYQEALQKLKDHGQAHLLHFFEHLEEDRQMKLLGQIDQLDVALIGNLYQDLVLNRDLAIEEDLGPIPSQDLSAFASEEKQRLWDIGLDAIARGKVAAFLVAGGQGSRLGFSGPKGAYDIGLPSHKSLFQLQAERLFRIGRLAGHPIPWYIMTSPKNHEETLHFFEKHAYFGLDPEDVRFFPQGTLPSVDEAGKILLDHRDCISSNPDGSGGCFRAFKAAGLLEDVTNKGIEHLFFFGVDNALVRVCDPYFIGFAIDQDKDIASKAVVKAHAAEKVGVFAYRGGKPSIIEYTELPEDLATAQDAAGRLLYGSGNILTHVFKLSFLIRALDKKTPYHIAHKVISHIDETGTPVHPPAPNGYKFEALYFDLFRHADDMAILNVKREEEFSPVKNLHGVDSKDSAREMFLDLCTSWVKNLGIQTDKRIEISPLLSIYGESLDPIETARRVAETQSGYIGPKSE